MRPRRTSRRLMGGSQMRPGAFGRIILLPDRGIEGIACGLRPRGGRPRLPEAKAELEQGLQQEGVTGQMIGWCQPLSRVR